MSCVHYSETTHTCIYIYGYTYRLLVLFKDKYMFTCTCARVGGVVPTVTESIGSKSTGRY